MDVEGQEEFFKVVAEFDPHWMIVSAVLAPESVWFGTIGYSFSQLLKYSYEGELEGVYPYVGAWSMSLSFDIRIDPSHIFLSDEWQIIRSFPI